MNASINFFAWFCKNITMVQPLKATTYILDFQLNIIDSINFLTENNYLIGKKILDSLITKDFVKDSIYPL